jgi:hypothetical protein
MDFFRSCTDVSFIHYFVQNVLRCTPIMDLRKIKVCIDIDRGGFMVMRKYINNIFKTMIP